jgi:hypothetical protein
VLVVRAVAVAGGQLLLVKLDTSQALSNTLVMAERVLMRIQHGLLLQVQVHQVTTQVAVALVLIQVLLTIMVKEVQVEVLLL